MKIGMISEFYTPQPGGISEHVRSLSRELGLLGHQVVVITGRPGLSPPPDDQPVVRIGRSIPIRYNGSVSRISLGWNTGARLRQILRKEAFDVIHIHNPLMPVLPLLTIRAATCPMVATLHSNYPRDLLVETFRRPLRELMRRIQVFVPVSLASYRAFGSLFPGDFRIVPNGVDFDSIARMRELAAPHLRVQGRKPRILFVGALVPRKGLPVLIDAFTELRRRGLDVELHVVGGGPELRRAQRSVPGALRSEIHFHGPATRAEVLQNYAKADLFCAPSLGRESFGIVLLEGMAAGLPVVASDIEGYRDVVTHGVDGVLVPPGVASGLADALESLLGNAEERRRLGLQGTMKARQLKWRTIALRLESIYAEVIAAGKDGVVATNREAAVHMPRSMEKEWTR
jgi:phosphatidyl-myo-inositol alpha-mannosyltransferase